MHPLIGGVCLLLSALLAGLHLRRAAEERIRRLASAVSLIRHAQRKISLFNTPTGALFSDFSVTTDKDIERTLRTMPAGEAVEQIACTLESDGDILRKFWQEIGCGYKSDALATCIYCIETMEVRLKEAKESFEKRKSLYVSLPLLLVISIIVLIL